MGFLFHGAFKDVAGIVHYTTIAIKINYGKSKKMLLDLIQTEYFPV